MSSKTYRVILLTAVSAMMFSAMITQKAHLSLFTEKEDHDFSKAVSYFSAFIDTPQVPGNYHDSLNYDFEDVGYDAPMYYQNGGLTLNNPNNIKTDVTYDPATGKYIVTQKIGDLLYRPPVEMDEEEYRNFVFKQGVKNYWKQR